MAISKSRCKKRALTEKKRRLKINNYLEELAGLIPSCCLSKQNHQGLDKAGILEIAVDYLHKLQERVPYSPAWGNTISVIGYYDCVQEVRRCLAEIMSHDDGRCRRLIGYLDHRMLQLFGKPDESSTTRCRCCICSYYSRLCNYDY